MGRDKSNSLPTFKVIDFSLGSHSDTLPETFGEGS